MRKIFLNWQTAVLLFVVLIGGLYLRETYTIVPVGNVSEAPTGSQQQTKEYVDAGEKDVTLSVTVEQRPPISTIVRVALNTHSVNLDSVDFGKHVRIEKNGTVFLPSAHEDDGGDHHRTSTMTFPYTPLPFAVIGQDIGGVEQRRIDVE